MIIAELPVFSWEGKEERECLRVILKSGDILLGPSAPSGSTNRTYSAQVWNNLLDVSYQYQMRAFFHFLQAWGFFLLRKSGLPQLFAAVSPGGYPRVACYVKPINS